MNEGSKFMNEALLTGRYRGTRTGGLIDRLPGADMGSDRITRLNSAMARFEAAAKIGDEIGRDIADAEIDAILDEGRAEAMAQAAQHAAVPIGPSFDGGVRRMPVSVRREQRLSQDPSPARLMRLAMEASLARRA